MFPEFNSSNYEMYKFANAPNNYISKPKKYKCLDLKDFSKQLPILQMLEICRQKKATHAKNISGPIEEKLKLARVYKVCLLDPDIFKHIAKI